MIGAGASGMSAALQAAWNGAAVTLFERNQAVGRKLLVTGSGRCNITNEAAAAAAYTCADQQWMETLFNQFGVHDLLGMLSTIGIPVQRTSDGWYYPLSNSAQSVVEVFASAVSLAGVTLSTQTRITGLQISSKGIIVRSTQNGKEQENEFERVIVSAGGCAYPSLGSRGELFPELKRLGHTVLPNRPALAPILANLGSLQPLQGIRLNVGASLWKGSQCFATSRGNLIFTEWGLNGPALMDISHIVSAQPDADLELSLNFLAFFPDEFDQLLAQKRKSSILLGVFLDAFFPPKVSAIILRNARLSGQTAMNQTSDSVLDQLANNLKDTRLTVKGTRDFEFCQISAGGVPVNEVDPRTLESRLIKGLYLTGETLDVIGPCGGYNLQYAFSSGALAGKAAAG